MELNQVVLIEQEVRCEGGRKADPPVRRVAACATFQNPFAGAGPLDDHSALVELSAELGEVLTAKALARLEAEPRAYGKAVLVGTDGDLEQGAALIHVRIGLSMRRAVGRGLALIPGNAKVAPPGTPVDLVFGGLDDGWDYDAMDTMPIVVPGAPKPDEFLLIVGFATGRPNARIKGASAAQVAELVKGFGHR